MGNKFDTSAFIAGYMDAYGHEPSYAVVVDAAVEQLKAENNDSIKRLKLLSTEATSYDIREFKKGRKYQSTKERRIIMIQEEIARVCHNVNKAYCQAIGDLSQVEWELAPEWQRQSAINGVAAHIESGFTMKPEDSHFAWMEEKVNSGWVYGEVKDVEKKTHPCIIPYDKLPQSQKIKDYLFREVVHCLGKDSNE